MTQRKLMNTILTAVVPTLMIVVGIGMAWISPSAEAAKGEPLQPVDYVDPGLYAGEYFEIALIPYFFQKDCARNAFVRYTPLPEEADNGATVFKDYFRCEESDGDVKEMTGRAKVKDTETNAVLSATFLNLFGYRYWFGKNYWIIDRGENYEYTVVGEPDRDLAWILARTPSLSKQTLTHIADTLTQQGYDACELEMSPQTDGVTERQSLCQWLEPSEAQN